VPWGMIGNTMYKIQNTTSDIKLQHPKSIANRFIIDDNTVKLSGIILHKPYKLQITAVAIVKGKKKS
jgi:hypothetical protein